MADTLTILNNGAKITVREVLSEKKVKKDGTIEKAKFGDVIEIPEGAIELDKLTAEYVLKTYKERCSIVKVSSSAKGDSKEVAKLQEKLAEAEKEIEALKAENAELKGRIEELAADKSDKKAE